MESYFLAVWGYFALYSIFISIKSLNLFVKINTKGIVINHSNNKKEILDWKDISAIGFQAVIPYLKPIPQIDSYLVIKVRDSTKYKFFNLKTKKAFIKLKSDFNSYWGEKSGDIFLYISKNNLNENQKTNLEKLLTQENLSLKNYKPLIKTTDQNEYKEITNKYFDAVQ